MVVPYTMFMIMLCYTVTTVLLNLLNIWFMLNLPSAVVIFEGYFIPGLIFGPCAIVVCCIVYLRRHKLSICADCRLQNDSSMEKGRSGVIFSQESELQIKNLLLLFTIVTTIFWLYYELEFVDASITARDAFVFTYMMMAACVADMLFFGMRYYNLYLDLKERDELVSPGELANISTRTYLRYYVICGDNILLSSSKNDALRDIEGEIFETPFIVRQIVKGIPEAEVKEIIERTTGVKNGILRFFFGRRVNEIGDHRIMRYFYFLPGEPSDYPALAKKGEWLSSEKFKTIYNTAPLKLGSTLLGDMSRLATIMVTSKTFDENGERRLKLMQYRPSFNFAELHNTPIDFHDELWIRVSLYNSDHRFFRLKRWLRHNEKKRKNLPFNQTPLS